MSWEFVEVVDVLAIHDEQIAEHGGDSGVFNEHALLSALDRPRNLALYEEPDAADMAAAYLVGIAKAHPFNDGNKRTAWVVSTTFLELNGHPLPERIPVASSEAMVVGAATTATVSEIAAWFRKRLRPAA